MVSAWVKRQDQSSLEPVDKSITNSRNKDYSPLGSLNFEVADKSRKEIYREYVSVSNVRQISKRISSPLKYYH